MKLIALIILVLTIINFSFLVQYFQKVVFLDNPLQIHPLSEGGQTVRKLDSYSGRFAQIDFISEAIIEVKVDSQSTLRLEIEPNSLFFIEGTDILELNYLNFREKYITSKFATVSVGFLENFNPFINNKYLRFITLSNEITI